MKTLKLILFIFFVCLVGNVSSQSIAIVTTTNMCFGSFAVSNATGGTITIYANGTRSATGGITLVAGTTPTAAAFTVTGTVGHTYNITSLSGISCITSSGGNNMTIDTFTSNPVADGTATGSLTTGSQILYVGATLHILAAQPSGTYPSGTGFTIQVQIN